jgi:hypothetical protein
MTPMTRTLRLLCLAALAAALSACATAGPYAAASRPGGAGYSELRIENDRYRVSYRGAPGQEAASNFALYRAAELAVNNGYDWFIVDQRNIEANGPSGPRVSVGVGGGSYGRHTSVGIGTSIGIPIGGGARTADASLEARFGRGPKPADANAYDARQILQSLRPPTR